MSSISLFLFYTPINLYTYEYIKICIISFVIVTKDYIKEFDIIFPLVMVQILIKKNLFLIQIVFTLFYFSLVICFVRIILI